MSRRHAGREGGRMEEEEESFVGNTIPITCMYAGFSAYISTQSAGAIYQSPSAPFGKQHDDYYNALSNPQ